MKKLDTLKIFEWSTKTLIVALLDLVVIEIGNFQNGLVAFIFGAVLFFVLLAGLHFGMVGFSKLRHWVKTPDQKLLILEPAPLYDRNRALLFINKEFRAPYIRIEKMYLGYEQRIALSVIPEKYSQKVEHHPYHTNWQKLKIRLGELPLELQKSRKLAIDFIKIDPKNNQFYFDLEEMDKVTFDIATHIFQVAVTYNVKNETGKIKRYKVRVIYQGADNLEMNIEHFD